MRKDSGMRLRFLFLGRTKEKYLAAGIDDFLYRLRQYAPAEQVTIRAGRADDSRSEQIRAQDTERLLARVLPEEVFVCLDPAGRGLTSEELADWLKTRMDLGARSVAFGLGGPHGFTNAAVARANLVLSLSPLTLTHEMSRLVLLEQIYRAFRLIHGHPYHK